MNKQLETFFDTPERLSNEEILNEIIRLKENSLMNQIIEGFPELAVILNEHRQIVALNSKALTTFNVGDYFEIAGKRLGEALNCIHSNETEAGCGTSKFCRECGAAKAIKKCKDENIVTEEECRITAARNGNQINYDFSVHAHPIFINNKRYTFFTVRDISSVKRREALERIFFHDILNTAGAIRGLVEILPESESEEERKDLENAIHNSINQLIEEILAQRQLRNAEDGNLTPEFSNVSANSIIEKVFEMYKNHELAHDNLTYKKLENDITISTDQTLLVRSMGNLIKNALEASSANQKVEIGIDIKNENIIFYVKNDAVIPENVQLQLFQRSFSTKASKGRGIGLYSVKLIVEQYLNGKVEFVSNETEKTIFKIKLIIH
ncbi:sensor histidine kinase [Stygiobacter electus]|uniref:histidine kinase n=1 Tax=Stygiobacter electus TaxID=3032292 RepID=A0AAE3P1R4_9BACT|nr:HAMP domain-containing sensor histidine kinase [Stygiobacter electus]MDF1612792.1 HAMP domain-containing sensor histidine kinase [Stygiobacter electus]